MSILSSRLRRAFLNQSHNHRHQFSTSILSPDSSTPLSTKQKTRTAISLLKTETNPERILEICRAASLSPNSHLDRIAFSLAVSKLTASNHFDGIRQFLDELKTRPDLRNERFLCHSIVLFGHASKLDHSIRTFHFSFSFSLNVWKPSFTVNSASISFTPSSMATAPLLRP